MPKELGSGFSLLEDDEPKKKDLGNGFSLLDDESNNIVDLTKPGKKDIKTFTPPPSIALVDPKKTIEGGEKARSIDGILEEIGNIPLTGGPVGLLPSLAPAARRWLKAGSETVEGLQGLMARDNRPLDERAAGASKAVRGGIELALPVIAPAMAGRLASLRGALGLGTELAAAGALQHGVESGARYLGAGKGTSALLGDVAGVLPFGAKLGETVADWALPRQKPKSLPFTEAEVVEPEVRVETRPERLLGAPEEPKIGVPLAAERVVPKGPEAKLVKLRTEEQRVGKPEVVEIPEEILRLPEEHAREVYYDAQNLGREDFVKKWGTGQAEPKLDFGTGEPIVEPSSSLTSEEARRAWLMVNRSNRPIDLGRGESNTWKTGPKGSQLGGNQSGSKVEIGPDMEGITPKKVITSEVENPIPESEYLPSPGQRLMSKEEAFKTLFGEPTEKVKGIYAPEAEKGRLGLLELMAHPDFEKLPIEDQNLVREQAEALGKSLGIDRKEMIKKGLPRSSYYNLEAESPSQGATSPWATEPVPDDILSSMIGKKAEKPARVRELKFQATPEELLLEDFMRSQRKGSNSVGMPSEATSSPIGQRIREALSGKDGGLSTTELRQKLAPEAPKEEFDNAILDLYKNGKIYLDRHDYPAMLTEAEKAGMVTDGQGNHYVGISEREPLGKEFQLSNPSSTAIPNPTTAQALSQLQKELPGLKVTADKSRNSEEVRSFWLNTPGGAKAEINLMPEIKAATPPGTSPTGAYVTGENLIWLSNRGLMQTQAAPHEAFHFAFEQLLHPRERAALTRHYGSEEDAAIAFKLNGDDPEGVLNSLRGRLQAMAQAIMPSGKGVMERLQRTNHSSIWERQRMGVDATQKYSLQQFRELMSGMGLQSIKEDVPLWNQAVKPAIAHQKWAEIVAKAGPKIAEAIEQGPEIQGNKGWDILRDALVDSRLAGIQHRFAWLADKVGRMTDDQIINNSLLAKRKDLPDGDLVSIARILDQQQGTADRVSKIQAMLQAGDIQALRDYYVRNFYSFTQQVNRVDLMQKYGMTLEQILKDPRVGKGLGLYKQMIEIPAKESHAANEGVFSNFLGPAETYFPLSVQMDANPGILATARQRERWFRPDNPLNHFAVGNAEAYDPSVAALVERLSSAERANRKAELMEFLIEKGLAVKGAGPIPERMAIQGQEVPIKAYDINALPGMTGLGRQFQWIGMPKAVARDLDHILMGAKFEESAIRDAISAVTGASLFGPIDNSYHMHTLLTAAYAGTPWIPASGLGKVLFKLPIIKQIVGGANVAKSIQFLKSPQGADWYEKVAIPGGFANPRAGRVTNDPVVAREGGLEYIPHPFQKDFWTKGHELTPEAEKSLRDRGFSIPLVKTKRKAMDMAEGLFSTAVYGRHGVDAAVRHTLWKYYTTINPEYKPAELAEFVNQAANYNWYLQGQMEREIKKSLLGQAAAPFVTAGSTHLRNGLRATLGLVPGMPKGDPLRSAYAGAIGNISGGTLGFVLLWAGINKAINGQWPWEDENSRIGRVRIPAEVIEGNPYLEKVAMAMAGDRDNREVYLNIAFLNPWAKKGLDMTGISGAYDGWQLGARDGAQLFWDGMTTSANSFIRPMTSGAAFGIGLAPFGYQPHITSFYDDRGNWGPQFYRKVQPAANLPGHILNAVGRGIQASNSLIGDIGQSTAEFAMGRPWDPRNKGQYRGNPAVQSLLQVLVPRLEMTTKNMDFARRQELKVKAGRDRNQAKAETLIEEVSK